MLQQNFDAPNTPISIDSALAGPDLTEVQVRAIAALHRSPSIEAAADNAGVELTSLRRWMRHDEGFQSKMRQIRHERQVKLEKQLQKTALAAIANLIDLAQAKKLVEPGRASLIRTVVEFAFRPPRYDADIQDRLTAAEKSDAGSAEKRLTTARPS